MTADEAIKYMNKITSETIWEFGTIMRDVAETANTLINLRVNEKGIDAEGNPFPPYSTKPMLVNCSNKYMTVAVCNQLAGSKAKRKELKWVTIKKGDKAARLFELDGGYKEFRDLHGRRTDIVDFNFSGEMWANIQVVSSDEEHQQGHARISTLSDEENKKLAGNTERKGEILMLSDGEVEQVSKILEDWLVAKWNE